MRFDLRREERPWAAILLLVILIGSGLIARVVNDVQGKFDAERWSEAEMPTMRLWDTASPDELLDPQPTFVIGHAIPQSLAIQLIEQWVQNRIIVQPSSGFAIGPQPCSDERDVWRCEFVAPDEHGLNRSLLIWTVLDHSLAINSPEGYQRQYFLDGTSQSIANGIVFVRTEVTMLR